ncbi:ATP-binding cassette domain-containing protein [Micromonospora sp. NPDC048999]|uniref:ATP-binding cassette domain-containing protein n=1 Tax=Micromonospora sp. NPDC048999 TaxID=3155391 RepID=UPI0033DAA1E1
MREPAVLLPIGVVALAFIVFCYVELARRPAKALPKPVWAVIIVASIPFGGIVYLLLGRGEPAIPTASATDTSRDRGILADLHAALPPPGDTETTADVAISTHALSKVFTGGVGLHSVDLSVPARGVYGLVGPNGAGKTTLMSLLAGLRHADSGEITTTARITLCPDTPAFEPWLTAVETVDLFRKIGPAGGMDPDRALALTGLADARDRKVGGFSRGMTQRLGLAVVLASGAEVLLLDEPTSALDPQGRADMLRLITALGQDRAVVVSSHILADVQRIAATVGVLREGRLIYQGSVRDLIEQHTRPSWRLELRSKVDDLAVRLRQQDWVVAVEPEPYGLRVDTTSLSAGEILLPAEIAASGAELVAFTPIGADLETVFLSMVGVAS